MTGRSTKMIWTAAGVLIVLGLAAASTSGSRELPEPLYRLGFGNARADQGCIREDLAVAL